MCSAIAGAFHRTRPRRHSPVPVPARPVAVAAASARLASSRRSRSSRAGAASVLGSVRTWHREARGSRRARDRTGSRRARRRIGFRSVAGRSALRVPRGAKTGVTGAARGGSVSDRADHDCLDRAMQWHHSLPYPDRTSPPTPGDVRLRRRVAADPVRPGSGRYRGSAGWRRRPRHPVPPAGQTATDVRNRGRGGAPVSRSARHAGPRHRCPAARASQPAAAFAPSSNWPAVDGAGLP